MRCIQNPQYGQKVKLGSAVEDVKQKNLLICCLARSHRVKQISVSNPEIPLLGIYPRGMKTHQCTEQVYS